MQHQNTKLKTLRLKTKLIEEVEKMAVDDNRNFNNMVETILMKAVSSQKRLSM